MRYFSLKGILDQSLKPLKIMASGNTLCLHERLYKTSLLAKKEFTTTPLFFWQFRPDAPSCQRRLFIMTYLSIIHPLKS
jgi:hypothetical protein